MNHLLPPTNEVWGKVIFSEACVKNSLHRVGSTWGPPPPLRYQAHTPEQQTPSGRHTPPPPGAPPQPGTPPDQVHPLDQVHPPDQVHPRTRYTPRPGTPPGAVHAGRYGHQAGGTHHTGMHSCYENKFCMCYVFISFLVYDPRVNPQATNSFATAAFRYQSNFTCITIRLNCYDVSPRTKKFICTENNNTRYFHIPF